MTSSKSHLDSDQFQAIVNHTPHTWSTPGDKILVTFEEMD